MFLVFRLAAPAAIAGMGVRVLRSQPVLPVIAVPKPLTRSIVIVFVFGYVATVIFGIPAVSTHTYQASVDVYKSVPQVISRAGTVNYPKNAIHFVLPIAPGVVATYETQHSWTSAFQGVCFYAWFPGNVVEVGRWTRSQVISDLAFPTI